MAIIKKGVYGNVSGKMGESIVYQLKGQTILRSINEKRTDKPTEKQIINRKKFGCSQQWLQPITSFLRVGFMDYQPTFEGFVAAKSYNHKHAVLKDENDEFFVDPTLALVSFGSQPLPRTASASCTENQEVVITWSTEGEYPHTDLAMVLLYDPKKPAVHENTAAARRKAGTATHQLKVSEIGAEFLVYLAFVSDDRKNRSNSIYLGSLKIR